MFFSSRPRLVLRAKSGDFQWQNYGAGPVVASLLQDHGIAPASAIESKM